MLAYTSGTTGNPKGCMHTHGTMMTAAVGSQIWRSSTPESVVLAVAPMFHLLGMQNCMNSPIYLGATVVLMPRWDRALAADLTWPKLCARWRRTPRDELREKVAAAARDARGEEEFFHRLAEQGVLVRLRHSQTNPGQVTGYAVSLPGMTRTAGRDGRFCRSRG